MQISDWEYEKYLEKRRKELKQEEEELLERFRLEKEIEEGRKKLEQMNISEESSNRKQFCSCFSNLLSKKISWYAVSDA